MMDILIWSKPLLIRELSGVMSVSRILITSDDGNFDLEQTTVNQGVDWVKVAS